MKEWYLSIEDKKLQSYIFTKLEHIRRLSKDALIKNNHIFSDKSNKKSDLWEILISFKGNEYRIIFYFDVGDLDKSMVMLDVFMKKDKKDNRDGFSAGLRRKGELEDGRGQKIEYYFTKD